MDTRKQMIIVMIVLFLTFIIAFSLQIYMMREDKVNCDDGYEKVCSRSSGIVGLIPFFTPTECYCSKK